MKTRLYTGEQEYKIVFINGEYKIIKNLDDELTK